MTTQANNVAIESSQINSAGVLQRAGGGTGVINNPTFLAYQTTVQSIPSGVVTQLTLDTALFDTDGCYNNTASPVVLNGITVPAYAFAPDVPGYYQVNSSTYINVGGNVGANHPVCYCYVAKNGDTLAGIISGGGVTDGNFGYANASGVIYFNGVSDYIQLFVGQYSSGGTKNTDPGLGSASNFLCATLIRGQ